MPLIVEPADDPRVGHCAAVAALVIALDKSGVLDKSAYREALRRLWLDMADEEATGEAGAVIERVLDLLDAPADENSPAADAEDKRRIWPLAG